MALVTVLQCFMSFTLSHHLFLSCNHSNFNILTVDFPDTHNSLYHATLCTIRASYSYTNEKGNGEINARRRQNHGLCTQCYLLNAAHKINFYVCACICIVFFFALFFAYSFSWPAGWLLVYGTSLNMWTRIGLVENGP